jgi:hypothetical protein
LGIKPYNLGKVRPELRNAVTFAEASTIPNLDTDEAEFFKKTYYLHSNRRRAKKQGQTKRGSVLFS